MLGTVFAFILSRTVVERKTRPARTLYYTRVGAMVWW